MGGGATGSFVSCACMNLDLGTGSVRDIFNERGKQVPTEWQQMTFKQKRGGHT